MINAAAWDTQISILPGAHILQTWEWGLIKSAYGWAVHPLIWEAFPDGRPVMSVFPSNSGRPVVAAALVLERTLSFGGFTMRLRIQYIPKGPLLDWDNAPLRHQVLADLERFARRRGAIFVKMDPDIPLGWGIPGEPSACESGAGLAIQRAITERGWLFSAEQIQFRNTVEIDLRPEENGLLAGMKQKTRYNIRLAERKGVKVRTGTPADFTDLYRMYAETSVRDGFVIREEAYYRAVWQAFTCPAQVSTLGGQPVCEPLIAEVDGVPVAAVVIFRFAQRAWYLYGMSIQAHREKMPNYLLQWEAMRRAQKAGCTAYDLWGAPDVFTESDPLWGVFRFKEGLGGQVARHLGAWDWPVNHLFYHIYTQTLPRILDIMRRRGKERVQRQVGA